MVRSILSTVTSPDKREPGNSQREFAVVQGETHLTTTGREKEKELLEFIKNISCIH
jgi:hypothetical protein